MSSGDSDDDSLYTNSVSKLKKIKQKVTAAKSAVVEQSIIQDFITDTVEVKNNRKKRPSDEGIEENENYEVVEKASVILIDSESENILDVSENSPSVDIIQTIDRVLSKSTRGRSRKQRPRKCKKVQNTEVVFVCSDSETSPSQSQTDPSFNEDNYTITLKVCWKSQNIQRFEVKRKDELYSLFSFYSEKEKIPESRLLFTLNEKVLSKHDSPFSLDIQASDIIEGGIISEKVHMEPTEKDMLELKVVCQGRKKPLNIKLMRDQNMSVFMSKCAEELNVPVKTLKFSFDGDKIEPADSFSNLGIESGDCIDCWEV